MNDYITPTWETIGAPEKRNLMELCSSTIVNGFSMEDYFAVVAVFRSVIDRLEKEGEHDGKA